MHSVTHPFDQSKREGWENPRPFPPGLTSQRALDPPSPFLPMPLESLSETITDSIQHRYSSVSAMAIFSPQTSMKSDSRIVNLTRNCKLKFHQAEARIKAGVAAWVEKNVSMRELTIAEVIEYRQSNRRFEETLEPSEVHGLTFEPPSYVRPDREILGKTLKFYKQATA